MLFWLYWGMTALVAAGLLRLLWRSPDWREQALAALVLVPLLLRVWLLK
ncbi:MAG: hypothetical protein WC326_06595 [Candidatus Delongbacteria bacterium]